jgi:hypothetical protein
MSSRLEWMRDALCACFPMFPWTIDGHRVDAEDTDLMAKVCQLCPVLAQCRAFVETVRITAGFWAGEHRTEKADTVTPEAA